MKSMNKRLIAELSMPGVNSWNGKWSGEDDKYTINVPSRNPDLIGYYHYNFGDDWESDKMTREERRNV